MTPQEVFDYKLKWMPGYTVRLHSDLWTRGQTWCSKFMDKHKWNTTKWTNAYEHTFHFEEEEDAEVFSLLWPEFTNQ